MPISILATKLYIPPPRPNLVERPRLIARMDQALHGKLTLVSAPAGFGKTTLTATWVTTHDRPVAWLSLGPEESDPSRFLTYAITAIQSSLPHLGTEILDALQSSQPPPPDALLTALVNELSGVSDPFVLVLDDYHLVDAKPVDNLLAFLLEHQPPQMHLIITTREDPQLPLARLRARGELTEIRATDLRFSVDEATEFLRKITGLELSTAEVEALEARTEGWIAGLQLAALSMQGRDDVHGFVAAFAGDHRYIVDYLVDEVLAQQPAPVRDFLLRTSILDQLTGPLCDAVTGQPDGNTMLESLERSNLFVTPLDDRRRWFRYHHLFADMLRAHLHAEDADLANTLHCRAAAWYEENDRPADAIRHALAAADFAHAAALLERSWLPMDRSRQVATWLAWAKALPHELLENRPVLAAALGWALLERGELEAAEERLAQVETWLQERAAGEVAQAVIVDQAQFAVLPATVASALTYLAQARGDGAAALHHARRALDLLPADDHLRRGVPASLLSLAAWAEGDLTAAATYMRDAMESFRQAGNQLYAVTAAYVLADIHRAQGRLHAAFHVCRQALQLAEGRNAFVHAGTADVYTGLAEFHCELNNLQDAADALARSRELGEEAALPRWRYRWCLAAARLHLARGDLGGALALLDEADAHYFRGPVPDVQPAAAWKARIWIAQGQLADARAWADAQTLSADDDVTYLREFEQITLARLLLAEHERSGHEQSRRQALTLLDRLLHAAEAGERTGSALEILVLQAVVHHGWGETNAALEPLERALDLAAPEGYVRVFLDAGPLMNDLLNRAVLHGVAPAYLGALLAEFNQGAPAAVDHEPEQRSFPAPAEQPLIEPLSERELEVLQLIAQGLSNREIGERLYLALSTVKGHNRNIYGKLGVQRRTEAVARGRDLGLID